MKGFYYKITSGAVDQRKELERKGGHTKLVGFEDSCGLLFLDSLNDKNYHSNGELESARQEIDASDTTIRNNLLLRKAGENAKLDEIDVQKIIEEENIRMSQLEKCKEILYKNLPNISKNKKCWTSSVNIRA